MDANFLLFTHPLLVAFVVSFSLLLFFIVISKITNDPRNSSRHVHVPGTVRFGGVAIVLSFSVALFLNKELFISSQVLAFILASLAIMAFGVLDDLYELSWKTQLFFQVSVAVFIFIMGIRVEYVTNPFGGIFDLGLDRFVLPSLLFVILWSVIFMNSMNWIDGIDGLSGGMTLIGAMTVFFLSLKPEVSQPAVGLVSAALVGAVSAFLMLNFNPSKIIAGTSGSMFFGFILSVLAIFAGTKIATALLIMTVPIIDAFWVIFERIKNGQSVFDPDRRHLHHKLMDLGWSQRRICFLYYAMTGLIAIIALNTRAIGKLITIVSFAAILFVILYIVNKKIYADSLVENISQK